MVRQYRQDAYAGCRDVPVRRYNVRVVQAGKPTYWYADKIGQVYEVEDDPRNAASFDVYRYGTRQRVVLQRADVERTTDEANGKIAWKRREFNQ